MSKEEILNSSQEPLIAASDTGFALPRDFEAQDDGAVALSEYYIYLGNVLNMFDDVISLDQIARRHPMPKNPRTGFVPTKQQAISRDSARAAEQLRRESRAEFYRAYGIVALEASDTVSKEELERQASKTYDRFTMKFAGSHKTKARTEKRRLWHGLLEQQEDMEISSEKVPEMGYASEVDSSEPTQEDIAFLNQLSEERYANSVRRKSKNSRLDLDPKEQLSTRERMIAILEDPRGGFLPTTKDEVNRVVSYLDYLDEYKHQLGITDQLTEVYWAQERDMRYTGEPEGYWGGKAVRGIVHIMAENYRQASEQEEVLRDFHAEISDVLNPVLSLASVFGSDHAAMPLLARYKDLMEFARTGRVKGLRMQPLRTVRVERDLEPQADDRKVSVLFDRYTSPKLHEVYEERIANFSASTTIGDARKLAESTLTDQVNRRQFHEKTLNSLDSLRASGFMKYAYDIAQAALHARIKADTIA